MSLALAAKLARRELRGGVKGFGVFLACLAFGVAAIAAVGTVRQSIQAGLEREGATILGGDAVVRFTYRFAEPSERAWMDGAASEVSEIADFRSMVVVPGPDGDESALTQIKSIDAAYPLIGAPVLDPEIGLGPALDGRDGLPGAVMHRVLADRLGLAPGDEFRLGTQTFTLGAILVREPDSAAGGFSLGPRTIVRTEALENSGLLGPGTLFETEYRMRLPPGSDLAALEAEAAKSLEGSGHRWRDSRNGAPGLGDFVDRLSAFLVLVGLAGLAVGGVGIAAAVRSYVESKTGVIATLKTLGANRRTVFQTYLLQIGALTALGIAVGLILGAGAPLLLAPLIEARLPLPAAFGIYPHALLEATLYGLLTAALFSLWPLSRTESIRAAALFRDMGLRISGRPRLPWVFATFVLLACLVGSAAMLSGDRKSVV